VAHELFGTVDDRLDGLDRFLEFLAPPSPPINRECRVPRSPVTPIATYTGRLVTWPSRIFTWIASTKITGY